MALQTKTFKWGSFAWGSASNAYVLELTLTEESISTTGNTSPISYKLVLKSGSSNRFQCDVTSTLKLNGVQVASKTENKYLDYNSSWTLLSGTATVTHNADGSLTMPISVSIDAIDSNQYAPPDKTLNWSWALTKIPRASSIASVSDVTLGNACNVKWTPHSKSFRYKLKFTLGDWSHTTGVIHPNKTTRHTYTGYTLPLEVAEKLTDDKNGNMTVKLTTYSDSGCTKSLGSDSKAFKVTVPDVAETRPEVEMTLKPEKTPFAGLYVQGKTKVQATLSAEPKLGAEIENYSMTVEGNSYGAPYLSKYLQTIGEIEITGTAIDSRGIKGYVKEKIQVLPYNTPKLKNVEVYRCTSEGKPAENGEYLKIEATRAYAPVVADGVQKNFCKIQYQYKPENAEQFSEPETILEESAEENSVVTKPLLNATFSKEIAYTVQLIAVDTVGEDDVVPVQIPSERVFRHKRPGGRGVGYGGYCEEDDLLDVYWNQRVHGNLTVLGAINGVHESEEFPGCYCREVDGECEWLNPPMVPGNEYRTTDRHNGHVVYAKAFSVDALPNAGNSTITHNLVLGVTEFVKAEAVALRKGDDGTAYSYYNFPVIGENGAINAVIQYGANRIFITTFADMSAYRARITLWYCKL